MQNISKSHQMSLKELIRKREWFIEAKKVTFPSILEYDTERRAEKSCDSADNDRT